MKKSIIPLFIALFTTVCVTAQTAIYVPQAPSAKKTSSSRKKVVLAPRQSESFCLLVQFSGNDSTYRTADLDMFDSVYNIAFDRNNPHLYTMTIEGYGDANEALTERRVQNVYNYFAMRSHAQFPIRMAVNHIHSACLGDTTEVIRFEVPVERKHYNCNDLPDSRKLLNGSIPLHNCVLVTFKNNPDECLGAGRGCYVPRQDSTIRGYYASVFMPKGVMYSVDGTMDTCPHLQFRIEEHLDYKEIVEDYFLVPHPKQVIVQVGYVVLHSNINYHYGECADMLKDSIFVRFPVTQEQLDNKLRIFGKKYSEKGVTYKALTTKKMPSKVSLAVQTGLNGTQLDTIFLGKRIEPEEMKDYFYEVPTDIEPAAFTYNGKHYKAYSIDRHGEYIYKKAFRALLRITEDNSAEEEIEGQETDRRYRDDEEIEDLR